VHQPGELEGSEEGGLAAAGEASLDRNARVFMRSVVDCDNRGARGFVGIKVGHANPASLVSAVFCRKSCSLCCLKCGGSCGKESREVYP